MYSTLRTKKKIKKNGTTIVTVCIICGHILIQLSLDFFCSFHLIMHIVIAAFCKAESIPGKYGKLSA